MDKTTKFEQYDVIVHPAVCGFRIFLSPEENSLLAFDNTGNIYRINAHSIFSYVKAINGRDY